MNRRLSLIGLAGLLATSIASAQSLFLPAGDSRLRDDVSLLVDEGVINLPVNEWPLAREDVAEAISSIDTGTFHDPSLRAAFSRVVAATTIPGNSNDWELREVRVTAGQPALLRTDATLGRENGEVTSIGGAGTDRYSITVAATGVLDASDGQDVRFDGSEITVRWGNWLFSATRWTGGGGRGGTAASFFPPMPGPCRQSRSIAIAVCQ